MENNKYNLFGSLILLLLAIINCIDANWFGGIILFIGFVLLLRVYLRIKSGAIDDPKDYSRLSTVWLCIIFTVLHLTQEDWVLAGLFAVLVVLTYKKYRQRRKDGLK